MILHVVGVVAAARRRQHADLLEPVEHVGGHVVALAPAASVARWQRARGCGPPARSAPPLRVVERALDQPQRHEALLLQALDQRGSARRSRAGSRPCCGYVRTSRAPAEQPLAQVVLDRAGADTPERSASSHIFSSRRLGGAHAQEAHPSPPFPAAARRPRRPPAAPAISSAQ